MPSDNHTAPATVRADAGSAMILTLMVMALVTALSTTVAVVTINNLQASWRAQQAGAALNAADAGIAQAMAYLRNSGVRGLACSPSCGSNAWGSSSTPASVTIGGAAGQGYQVWIEKVAAFPANDPGVYRIHSTGTARGAASRVVLADVKVTTTQVPKGVFARTINGGGAASVARESIFSTGCVYNRDRITMVTEPDGSAGKDLAYGGIPIAVHSSQIITKSNGTGQYCPTTNMPIHRTGARNQTPQPCNSTYKYDQDRLGGVLASTTCYDARMASGGAWGKYYAARDVNGDGSTDVEGSFIKDDATLFSLFGIRTPVLTQAQIDQLKTVAISQNNYELDATPPAAGWDPTQGGTIQNAVLFFDLQGAHLGDTVDLKQILGYARSAIRVDDSTCPSKSLVIVIEGGNAILTANTKLAASLFLTSSAPNGQLFKDAGNSEFIGTIYADTVNLAGTADISMDECFLANTSPALLDLSLSNYREEDRGLG